MFNRIGKNEIKYLSLLNYRERNIFVVFIVLIKRGNVMQKFIAIDLGAENGRVIMGDVSEMEVIHRFLNKPVRIKDSIYWDILNIFIA